MRDLAAGVGLSLLAIAGMVALMAWQVEATAPGGDPDCELSHQALHLDADLDLWRGRHQLSWSVINVCDRYRLMPPADTVPLSP